LKENESIKKMGEGRKESGKLYKLIQKRRECGKGQNGGRERMNDGMNAS
jgi:hypothetical protein